jgi:predicted methyltransferase
MQCMGFLVGAVAFAPLVSACSGGALAKVDLWRLVTSGRDGYQRPEMVIEALDLRPGATVAEIGAGDGYWLAWLSKAVGTEGKVLAVEVEADKAEELRQLVENQGFGNVEVVLGRYEDPLLPDGAVDLAITSKTYHHIEARVAYFRRLRRDLAPHGRVAHLDDRHDLPFPLSWLTAGHTSDPATIEAEMTEAGYRRLAQFDFIYTQSFLVYGPLDAPAAAED